MCVPVVISNKSIPKSNSLNNVLSTLPNVIYLYGTYLYHSLPISIRSRSTLSILIPS